MEQASNKMISNIFNPFVRFLKVEAAGGIVLLAFTALALVLANSPLAHDFEHFWENKFTIGVGSFSLSKTIHHWINDGLMAIFFFVVGLEIKREILTGQLSSLKQSSLPIAAALGGMIVPALMYALLNKEPQAASGWGIPMATDIAFSLGVLNLLGKRVPVSLKVFLVAFAIVDDLGAVLIIAIFYSAKINVAAVLTGLALLAILILFNRLRIRHIVPYMVVGWVIWYFFLMSGIHPTIAGVLIALTIPLNRQINVGTFRYRMDENLGEFCESGCADRATLTHAQLAAIDNMEVEISKVQSPLQRLEHSLHRFVTFVVMPLFAFSNAGVNFTHVPISEAFNMLSIVLIISLVAGKVLGISLFSWLTVKLGWAELPAQSNWNNIIGVSFLGGMGFTMSLFITNLAFHEPILINPAKTGILVGSLVAGVLGYLILKSTLKKKTG
ncbi:MAG: Na+/H+ antiporter NhaA [Bacteroidales bacterium]|nr:Na+/H+ antiporter NhaA [Bacteroidales bacterium]